MTIRRLGAAAVVAALAGSAWAEIPERYTIVDTGTLGGAGANGLGLNNLGHVVGQAEMSSGATGPFVYRGAGAELVPGLHTSNAGRADEINDRGDIVGSAMTPAINFPGTVSHALFWSAQTGPIDLAPGLDSASFAAAVNEARQVIGEISGGPQNGAYLWTVADDGTFTRVAIAFPGAPAGFANAGRDINNNGLAVGGGYNADFRFRPWAYDASTGEIAELPIIAGLSGEAWGVNDAGQIVGTSSTTEWPHPVLWNPIPGSNPPAWEVVDLGVLPPPYDGGEGEAINNAGQVVGWDLAYGVSGVRTKAWIWEDGQKVDLDSLLSPEDQLRWELWAAIDINDQGQITGIGVLDGVDARAFLLTPVETCPADFDGSGDLTLADFVAFRNAYTAGDMAADFDGSGDLTLADFVAFRNAYTAGCS